MSAKRQVETWIVILGKGGVYAFRDGYHSICNNETSKQTSLTALPATWPTGHVWGNSCPVSAYGFGTIGN